MSLFFRSAEKRSSDRVAEFVAGEGGAEGVSLERALHLIPAFASVRHIVDYVSTLPVDFYRKNGDRRTPAPVPELIRNADDEYGLDNWFGQLAFGIATRGNAVGKITAMGQSGPTMIEWAQYWSSVGYAETDPWFINGKQLGYQSVAQVRWIAHPGRRLGLSPIEHFMSMARAGLSAQEYANVGRGGGLPLAELTNTLLSEMPEELIAAARSAAVSAFASGRPFVHGKDWTLTPVAIPPNQLQFIETLKLSATQIAAIYGIDPREIGGAASESLTYTNDESRALNRAHNMRPYLVRIENAVNRWISGPVYMKFNIDATIRADVKTRTDVIGAQIADGRLSVDEARALDDLPPVLNGDVHKVDVGETKSDSASRIIQQVYLGVGKVITLKEAREIVNSGAGTDLDPDIPTADVQADLPPLPEPPAPTAAAPQ